MGRGRAGAYGGAAAGWQEADPYSAADLLVRRTADRGVCGLYRASATPARACWPGSRCCKLAAILGTPFLLANAGFDTYGLPAFGWLTAWFLAFAVSETAARALGTEQRKFAQSALGKYLPRDIAAQIMKDPASLSLTGEKREIFVLFTDLEGFTKLSHAIAPEMVASLLNRYLESLSDVVLRHGGTIDKFVGDAVVAFWGAPLARPDDGERAVRAALAMFQAVKIFATLCQKACPPSARRGSACISGRRLSAISAAKAAFSTPRWETA
jgi:hypothetical protein